MSLLTRIKERLARKNNTINSPEAVSKQIALTAEKISDERNLREIQRKLLELQLQFKADAPIRAEAARFSRETFRARIRQPQASAIAHDVVSDYNGRLYMGCSNGQLLRCDKPHKNLTLRTLIHGRLTADAKAAGISLQETVATPAAA